MRRQFLSFLTRPAESIKVYRNSIVIHADITPISRIEADTKENVCVVTRSVLLTLRGIKIRNPVIANYNNLAYSDRASF